MQINQHVTPRARRPSRNRPRGLIRPPSRDGLTVGAGGPAAPPRPSEQAAISRCPRGARRQGELAARRPGGTWSMCGITGWIDFERDLSTERATIEAMTGTMACRGPDAAGTWCSARALIGHRRLAVVDIPGGVQPMADAGVVLTFSGEIYNFRELRRELEGFGHVFRTRSDTEV